MKQLQYGLLGLFGSALASTVLAGTAAFAQSLPYQASSASQPALLSNSALRLNAAGFATPLVPIAQNKAPVYFFLVPNGARATGQLSGQQQATQATAVTTSTTQNLPTSVTNTTATSFNFAQPPLAVNPIPSRQIVPSAPVPVTPVAAPAQQTRYRLPDLGLSNVATIASFRKLIGRQSVMPFLQSPYVSYSAGVNNFSAFELKTDQTSRLYDVNPRVGTASALAFGFNMPRSARFPAFGSRVEAEVARRRGDITTVDDHLGTEMPASGHVSSISLMLNAITEFAPAENSRIRPYFGFGLGSSRVAVTNLESNRNVMVDDAALALSSQYFAGIGYRLTRRLSLNGEFRAFRVHGPRLTTVPQGVQSRDTISGNEFRLGLNFKL